MKELLERILTDLTIVESRAERFNYPPAVVADLRAARALIIRARGSYLELQEPSWPDTTKDREATNEARRRLGPKASDSAVVDLAQRIKKGEL